MFKYYLTEIIGQGVFGTVFSGYRLPCGRIVAVKRVTDEAIALKEIKILKKLRGLDPDKCNLVNFYGCFKQGSSTYIALERLNINIHNYMENVHKTYLPLDEIQAILHQTLVALNALKSIGIVHLDIKPDNIMLCYAYPLRVKLIDFGLATNVSEIEQGSFKQPTGYRAPEVTLGLPVTEAVDMWSLGCVAAFMYINSHLFPIQDSFEELSIIIQMQGQPANHVLDKGMFTEKFFWKKIHGEQHTWQLKTRDEYMSTNNTKSRKYGGISKDFHCVDDLLKIRQVTDMKWKENRAFLRLLQTMLDTDPAKRITPTDALWHQFLTMRLFPNKSPTDPSEIQDVEEPTPSTSCSFGGQNNPDSNTNNTATSVPQSVNPENNPDSNTNNTATSVPQSVNPENNPDSNTNNTATSVPQSVKPENNPDSNTNNTATSVPQSVKPEDTAGEV
ncbi:homeodomain-interacting protein kinase 2-like [Parambassis ranga]|uniref:Homeodomain-interacting protein kinase 2-like n=1 Tax=Parambassis ranga TaxID=210632 RepID=A0A6P7HT97_9TELE|nr:homeodomain-interacting protein kinase 2-like [Parambassis ranga]